MSNQNIDNSTKKAICINTFNQILKSLGLSLLISLTLTISAKSPNKIVVTPYFLDDPLTIKGVANGNYKASRRFNSYCSGFVARQANAYLEITEGFKFLRIYTKSHNDTTLVVENDSTGEVFCNDNAKGINPEVKLTPWPAGKYSIYVGRSQKNFIANFELLITEFQSHLEDFALIDEDSHLINIAPGFNPDPYTLPFEAGGGNLASSLGFACKGYIADKPDHSIKLTEFFEYLRIYVESKEDTTLMMVSRLTNRSYCNDDTKNFNPALSHERMPAGIYDIYVGMHKPDQRAPYTLYISQKQP